MASRMLLLPDLQDIFVVYNYKAVNLLNLPIQTSDSVKLVVKPINFCSLSVGLEPINYHGLYKHGFNSKTV